MANRGNITISIDVEGREAVAEFDKLYTQANKLKEGVKDLNKQNKTYREEIKTLRADLKNLTKGTEEYAATKSKIDALNQSIKQNNIESAKLIKTQGEVNAQLEQTRQKLGLNQMSFSQLKTEVNRLAKELNLLVPGTEAYIAKSEELTKVAARYNQVKSEIDGLSKKFKNQSDTLESLQIFTAQAFAVDKITSFAQEVDNSTRKIIDLRNEVQKLTGASGEQLDTITANIQAISETFALQNDEILNSTNALAKAYGVDVADAVGLVEKSLLNVSAAQRGELLDQIREYSVQAKDAGLSVQEFAGILVNSSNQGIFSDKGIDVVKEFGLRIREQTKATKDALNGAFGKQFTDTLLKGVNTGAISTEKALALVSAKLRETSLTASQAQTVIADVFGGPGEDAGLYFVKSLDKVAVSLDTVDKNSSKLTETQRNRLGTEKELATAQNELAKEYTDIAKAIDENTKSVQTLVVQGITNLIQFLRQLPKILNDNLVLIILLTTAYVAYTVEVNRARIATLAESIALKANAIAKGIATTATHVYGIALKVLTGQITITTIATRAFNLALRLNPLGLILTAVGLLIAGLVTLYRNFDSVKNLVNGAFSIFSKTFELVKNLVTFNFSGVIKSITGIATEASKTIKSLTEKQKTEQEKAREEENRKYNQDINKRRDALLKANREEFLKKVEADKKKLEAEKKQKDEETKQNLEKQKEQASKLLEKQKEYDQKALEAKRKLEELKAELIEDSYERERAKIDLDAKRRIEDAKNQIKELEKLQALGVRIDPEAIPALNRQIELIQTQAQKKINEVQLKQTITTLSTQEAQAKETLITETVAAGGDESKILEARQRFNQESIRINQQKIDAELQQLDKANADELLKIQELELKKAELKQQAADADIQTGLALIDQKYAALSEQEEIKFLEQTGTQEELRKQILDENFSSFLEAEAAREQALFDLQQARLEERLKLLIDSGQAQSAEARKINADLLKNEVEHNKKLIDNEKRTIELKKKLEEQSYQIANDFFQLGIDLLGKDEQARKKNASAIKAFTTAQIFIGLQREIQGIWENANKNPINALIPGWGPVFAGLQTGFAIARSALAISNVNSQEYGLGGVLKAGKKIIPLSQKNGVWQYESGGMVRNAGVLQGSSHAQGGLAVYDRRSGRQVAEFEGGEPTMVLSRKTYSNNKNLIDSLLYSSLFLNGAPVRYATGGVLNQVPTGSVSASIPASDTDVNLDFNMLLMEIREMKEIIANQQTILRAYVVYQDLQDSQTTYNNLVNKNSLGGS